MAGFGARSRERGRSYAEDGRVGALQFTGHGIGATVRGTRQYVASWLMDGEGWSPACTCPVGPECKHSYAVGCCVLAHAVADLGFEDPRLGQLLSAALVARRPSPLRGQLIPFAPEGTKRKSSAALERVRSARQIYEREYALGEMLTGAAARHLSPYLSPFPEILQEPDPDLRCYFLARALAERAGGWLPAELEPYRRRVDLETRMLQRTRASAAAELVRWAERIARPAQRSLRLVLSLRERASSEIVVSWQARVTTSRLKDQPRTLAQLQQLRNEVRNQPGSLAIDQVRLLEWLIDHLSSIGYGYLTIAELTNARLKSLLDWFSGSSLVTWAEDLDEQMARRAGISPGSPVRLSSEPVRLLPALVPGADGLCVELHFFWSQAERPFDSVVYLSGGALGRLEPSFVLADGVLSLVTEQPPADLVCEYRRVGALPVAPRDRERMIGLLASSFPHLRETVRAHTRHYSVSPILALDLRDDDWLQMRLFALAGAQDWRPGQEVRPGTILFEYAPRSGWVRSPEQKGATAEGDYERLAGEAESGSEAAAGDPAAGEEMCGFGAPPELPAEAVWGEAPDPERVEPVVSWLAVLEAAPGELRGPAGRQPTWPDRHVGWWLQAHRKRLDQLAELWDRRPAGVRYFGNDRFRRLLSAPERILPRLRVEPSGVDWFSVSAEWQVEGRQLSEADLAKLRAASTRFVKLPSGWVQRDIAALQDEITEALADLGIEVGEEPQRLTVWQLAGAQPESLQALQRLGADAFTMEAVRALRERLARFTGLERVQRPAGLRAELRSYQQTGLDFLTYTADLRLGAILADDMGLGKTVQALAWLEHLREREPNGGPSLVVCPASVVHNWAREAERFTPGMRVLLLTSGAGRHELRGDIHQHDLVVTNYALLRRDIEQWRKIELRAVILDEAQNVKNPDAAVTRAAGELQARHRVALTGTPLENRALDLWSITNFVEPGYLGSRAQFTARFDRVDAPPHARALLAAKMRPILLRRTKREVATDLPDRIEERRDCELTKGQRQLYLAELRHSRALIDELGEAPGGLAKNRVHVLAALTRLRQICCHPALAGGKISLGSGKFSALFELLEPLLAEGHKVLVFSQFVSCLRLLSTELRRQAVPHHMLTGQTIKRESVVRAFQEDTRPCVFLVSLKAGGTGLNLTAATYVVLFDPWWNPAVEAQAIDRTHRIGQDRTVIAYRMLAAGTIEEKIWELQQRKATLTRDILGEGGFSRALTREDLDYLFADSRAQ